MKSIKFLSLFFALAIAFTLSSCGSGEDPTPSKTNLELIKEAVAGTQWTFQSAVVVANSKTYNYSGNCDFSAFNDLGSSKNETIGNIRDLTYTFGSSNQIVSLLLDCVPNDPTERTYTITETDNKIYLKYSYGSFDYNYEILSTLNEIKSGTVRINLVSPFRGVATSVISTLSVN